MVEQFQTLTDGKCHALEDTLCHVRRRGRLGETTAAAPAETTAAATTALETTAAPTTAVPSPGENYGPGYVNEATTAAAAETNQAPSDMGLISPNGQ